MDKFIAALVFPGIVKACSIHPYTASLGPTDRPARLAQSEPFATMEAKLIVVGGRASKAVVKLKLPTVVGRGRDADLTVAHPTVSRHHCLIFEQDGVLVVRDNGSLNGTIIEGHRIQEAVLKPGDRLVIGPLTFRAEYESLSAGTPSVGGSTVADQALYDATADTPATGDLLADERLSDDELAETVGRTGAPVEAAPTNGSVPAGPGTRGDQPSEYELVDPDFEPAPAEPSPTAPAAKADIAAKPEPAASSSKKNDEQPVDEDLNDFFKSLGLEE